MRSSTETWQVSLDTVQDIASVIGTILLHQMGKLTLEGKRKRRRLVVQVTPGGTWMSSQVMQVFGMRQLKKGM